MRCLVEFIFPNRLHRLAYFLRGVMTDLLACFLYAFSGTNASSIWLVLLLATLAAYQMFFIIRPRICDIGMSSWWLLLMLVPGVNAVFGIILLFREPVRWSSRPDPALQATMAEP